MRRLAAIFLTVGAVSLLAGDQIRDIWDTGYRNKRPPAKGKAPSGPPAIDYHPQADAAQAIAKSAEASPVVGVTVWQLRKPGARDGNTPRLLVPDTADGLPDEYVAERIRLDQRIRVGDRLRLAIECPRDGYLYVIDRERYGNGGHGTPYLLFPLQKFNKGDNRVTPGRLIEVPGQGDRTPALRVDRRDPRHTGEELLLIFSAEPLPEVHAAPREQPLSETLVAGWERDFTPVSVRLDLVGVGGMWTGAEKIAGSAQRLLTPEDPMPQSIFVTTGDRSRPLLVRIPLDVEP